MFIQTHQVRRVAGALAASGIMAAAPIPFTQPEISPVRAIVTFVNGAHTVATARANDGRLFRLMAREPSKQLVEGASVRIDVRTGLVSLVGEPDCCRLVVFVPRRKTEMSGPAPASGLKDAEARHQREVCTPHAHTSNPQVPCVADCARDSSSLAGPEDEVYSCRCLC